MAQIVKNLLAMQEFQVRFLGLEDRNPDPRFDIWVGKIHGSRREWLLTPVFLPGEFYGERSLVGYSPWVSKSRTRLSDKHIDFESVQLCIVIDLVILFLVLCNI